MNPIECTQTAWSSDEEYWKEFSHKISRGRIPISGGLDLTERCNLNCRHCYLGPRGAHSREDELETVQWLRIIDEAAEAGCLYLLLTGGEPLLRRDFSEIYVHAKKRGLLTSIFTNGTLIDETVTALFQEYPPRNVEITLYGATAATYESITGVAGSFARCRQGIERLLAAGVRLQLKTILMSPNRHEYFQIESMAREYGVPFRLDAALFPKLDGDPSPMTLRVDPAEAVDMEMADGSRLKEWSDFLEKKGELSPAEYLFQCGAGLTAFHVDARGRLLPCVMVRGVAYDLLRGSFSEGWRGPIAALRQRPIGALQACARCDKRSLCGFCPGFFRLESGAEDVASEFLCRLGQHRCDKINSYRRGVQCEKRAE